MPVVAVSFKKKPEQEPDSLTRSSDWMSLARCKRGALWLLHALHGGRGRGGVECIDSLVFFSSRRRHTRLQGDWSSDVCSSDLSRRRHTRLQGDWSSDVCSSD